MCLNLRPGGYNGLGKRNQLMNGATRRESKMDGYLKIPLLESMESNARVFSSCYAAMFSNDEREGEK